MALSEARALELARDVLTDDRHQRSGALIEANLTAEEDGFEGTVQVVGELARVTSNKTIHVVTATVLGVARGILWCSSRAVERRRAWRCLPGAERPGPPTSSSRRC